MKYTHLILLLLLPVNLMFAQNAPLKLRHMEGFKSIKVGSTVNLGIDKKTNTLLVGYNHYLKENIFVGLDVSFESGEIEYSEVKNANLNAYFNYSVIDINKVFYFNVVGGFFGGLESAKSEIIDDNISSFVYGGLVGISVEIFVSNKICIEPFITQYWQGGSQLGNQFYNKGVSLKFNF